ncbi:MAG: hypothetical protein ACRDY7_04760, partial [Acidimicrobiia bacterium]
PDLRRIHPHVEMPALTGLLVAGPLGPHGREYAGSRSSSPGALVRSTASIGDDERSVGFKVVHLALAGVSIAFAVGIGRIGRAARRQHRASPSERQGALQ